MDFNDTAVKVKLTKIDYENFHDVIELELEESQEEHLPSNLYSLAESSFSSSYHTRAIWLVDEIVGFLMYQLIDDEDDEPICIIWRFMVDRRHQHAGIGTAAMALLLAEIKAHGACKTVEIYFDSNNMAATRLYAGYGFDNVGTRYDGDVIARLSV